MAFQRETVFRELSEVEGRAQFFLQRALCEEILADDPDHGPTWLRHAAALTHFGRFDEAEKAQAEAERHVPPKWEHLVHRARADWQKARGRFAEAAADYLHSSAGGPQHDDVTMAGQMFFLLGDHSRALDLLKKAIRMGGDDLSFAHHQAGWCHLARKEYEMAAAHFEQAIALDPDDRRAATRSLEDIRLIREEMASGKNSSSADLLIPFIRAAGKASQSGSIRFSCEALLTLGPMDWRSWLTYAEALRRFSLYAEASAALDQAGSAAPPGKRHFVLHERGHLHSWKGEHAAALSLFLEAAELAPHDATALVFAGSAAFKLGDTAKAISLARKAVLCPEGELDEAWFNLGGYLACGKEYEEARGCYLKSLAICPEEATRRNLADLEELLERVARSA